MRFEVHRVESVYQAFFPPTVHDVSSRFFKRETFVSRATKNFRRDLLLLLLLLVKSHVLREGRVEGVPAMRRLIKFSGPRARVHTRAFAHTPSREPETRVHALIRSPTRRVLVYTWPLGHVGRTVSQRSSSASYHAAPLRLPSQQPAARYFSPALSFTAFLLHRSPLRLRLSFSTRVFIFVPSPQLYPRYARVADRAPSGNSALFHRIAIGQRAYAHERAMRRASGTRKARKRR